MTSAVRSKTCPPCGKGIYPTQRSIIREILRRLAGGAPPLRWYRCPHNPRQFHITSK